MNKVYINSLHDLYYNIYYYICYSWLKSQFDLIAW